MANTQDYLIAIQLIIKGDTSTKAKLNQVNKALDLINGTSVKVGSSQQSMSGIIEKAAARALLVAPIWMLLRSALLLVVTTFQDMVKANLDLEDSMANIKGLLSTGFTGNLGTEMKEIETLIRDTATKSTIGIKGLSEAFIELKSSGMSTTEAVAAFNATWQLMQSQHIDAKKAVQALDIVYEALSDRMDKNLTVAQKYTKIGDMLAFAHAEWNLSTDNTAIAYAKLIPYIDTVKGGLVELTTIMGVLNDKGQAGARIGTSLSQSFVKVVTNAKDLSEGLNLKVDTSKQFDILAFMIKLSSAIKKMGPEALKTNAALVKVFGNEKTGAAAVLFSKNVDLITTGMAKAEARVEGYNEKVAEMNAETISGQITILTNNIANLGNDFWVAATGGDSFAESLKKLNEKLKSDDTVAKLIKLGESLEYFINLQKLTIADIGEPFAVLGALSTGQIKNMKQLKEATADNTAEREKYFAILMKEKSESKPITNTIQERINKETMSLIPPSIPKAEDQSTYLVNGKTYTPKEYEAHRAGQTVTNNVAVDISVDSPYASWTNDPVLIEKIKNTIEKILKDAANKIPVKS